MAKKTEAVEFGAAFGYPFKKAVRLLNILWVFIPIIGWFALFGYGITIVKHFLKNDFSELPKLSFGRDLNLGFFMFFKSIPFIIVLTFVNFIIIFIPFIGILGSWFISLIIVPVLAINFFNKETVSSYFEFDKVKYVFENFGDYIIALLKTIALRIIFGIMILILVGFPAGAFTQDIFMADFYRRFVKE